MIVWLVGVVVVVAGVASDDVWGSDCSCVAVARCDGVEAVVCGHGGPDFDWFINTKLVLKLATLVPVGTVTVWGSP